MTGLSSASRVTREWMNQLITVALRTGELEEISVITLTKFITSVFGVLSLMIELQTLSLVAATAAINTGDNPHALAHFCCGKAWKQYLLHLCCVFGATD